ncbi:MAG: hypothetical protein LLF97_09275 [Planctomycetaceae bacterium]|nr:hypothetical protein [Planctomycetaceae bacterium]
MEHNHTMIRKGLPLAIVAACALSHAVASEPPRSLSTTKAGEPQSARLVDDFNLPLIITMVVPEAPPEIRGPMQPLPVKKIDGVRSIPKKILRR